MKSQVQSDTDKLFKKICRKTGLTLRDHEMIGRGDHLLIGLSGGKDSMALLEVLSERRASLPFDFEISAAHISSTNIDYRINIDRIRKFCTRLKIPLHIRNIEPDFEADSKKAPCFICSWSRRKELFNLTKELGCNKLVLGHHRNDAVETMFMNMIFHGSISSLPYTLKMFDGRIILIRPFLDIDERLISDYTSRNKIVMVEKVCAYDNQNKRKCISQLIKEIENIHGKGAYNIFKSMGNIYTEYLPKKKPGIPEDPSSLT